MQLRTPETNADADGNSIFRSALRRVGERQAAATRSGRLLGESLRLVRNSVGSGTELTIHTDEKQETGLRSTAE